MEKKLFEDNFVHKFIEVNIYKDIRYFNKERFSEFVKWLFNILMINKLVIEKDNVDEVFNLYYNIYEYLLKSAEDSEYQLNELEEILVRKNIKD